MQIIGITGTLGAGKGEVVNYLVEKHGFTHYSARTFIVEEVKRRDMPINRDTITATANELRAQHGTDFIITSLFARARENNQDAIIESVRALGEIDALKASGYPFTLLAVDAEPRLRYERAYKRGSETDNITFEKFLEDEKREMSSDDPNKQNLAGCIARADFILQNNGTMPELHKQIEVALTKIS